VSHVVPEAEAGLEPWFRSLRERLLEITARRVPPGVAEDLVQEALSVVLQRGVRAGSFDTVDGLPPLAWSLQVMRNTIGNYYQKARTLSRHVQPLADHDEVPHGDPTPLDALELDESAGLIRETLEDLGGQDGQCGRYLTRLLDGLSPADLARSEGVEAAAFYRRLYRCRQKFRLLLMEKGVFP
jgi:RNA polymerase sigma factor (sigma-70 family)